MVKTIVIFSSSRTTGNTRQLVDDLSQHAKVDIADLSEYQFSDYDYEHKNIGDDFLPLVQKVLTYEQVIFASPVYWYSMTPTMKRFLDRITDLLDLPELLDLGRELRKKKAFVMATSVSDEIATAFIQCFEHTIKYLGMDYGGYLHMQCKQDHIYKSNDLEMMNFVKSIN